MITDPAIRDGIVTSLPSLRAFARSICFDADRADDLVQETLMRAWSSRAQFEPGTRLEAWLFTILRNTYYTSLRRQRREMEDPDGEIAGQMATPAPQNGLVDWIAFTRAFAQLAPSQRELLLLISAEGRSYAEIAEDSGVAVGTVKSRIYRARLRLAELMGVTIDDGRAGTRSEATRSQRRDRRRLTLPAPIAVRYLRIHRRPGAAVPARPAAWMQMSQ
ncbi:sigma-70 family RNA polymerase sigma factor [Salinarimonas soli]|uniref:sigma-70 family RNA polymerase sigma factor n=1 Tax=Salinarimonas soli TaxID=1638099 RepID=UPI0016618F65|nr:sigma-70 family RNA polymerase sigma factor [Salinarimonas soli]